MTRIVSRDVVTEAHVSTLPPGSSAYSNDFCRCRGCRDGNADYQAELRDAYKNRPDIYPVPHGTDNGYSNYRCRCEACCAVRRDAQRAYHARRKAASNQ